MPGQTGSLTFHGAQMMLRSLMILAVSLSALAVTEPALARHGDRDRGAPSGPVNVRRDQALTIARDSGVARVRETDLRGGIWKVEGWTAEGRAIEVRISAVTGEVLEVEFYN